MIVNDPRRFTWVHKKQTWMVEFGGYKKITYTSVPDDEYEEMMKAQLIQTAAQFGLTIVPAGATRATRKSPRR